MQKYEVTVYYHLKAESAEQASEIVGHVVRQGYVASPWLPWNAPVDTYEVDVIQTKPVPYTEKEVE